eukprot:872958-Karenia_brevis.AAC.1
MPLLDRYQLVVVDEISQLMMEHGDRLLKLRDIVDNVFAMAIMGDKMQMAGFGDNRPWDSRLWRQSTWEVRFWQPYRCIDQEYQRILDGIR